MLESIFTCRKTRQDRDGPAFIKNMAEAIGGLFHDQSSDTSTGIILHPQTTYTVRLTTNSPKNAYAMYKEKQNIVIYHFQSRPVAIATSPNSRATGHIAVDTISSSGRVQLLSIASNNAAKFQISGEFTLVDNDLLLELDAISTNTVRPADLPVDATISCPGTLIIFRYL